VTAQPFDAERGTTTGDAFSLAERIDQVPETAIAVFSASETGVLVYRGASDATLSRLRWFDRAGKPSGEVGEPDRYRNPRLSPDYSRVAVEIVDRTGNRDIWLMDVARGIPARFTFDPGRDASPVWSPDGSEIAWQGAASTNVRPSTGAGSARRLRSESWILDDWLPDASGLLAHSGSPTRVSLLPLVDGGGEVRPVIEGRRITSHARVSPDGRWVAFANADSDRFEIYLQDFPGGAGKWQVSTGGGVQPKWRPDGKELFYLSLDGRLMAVPMTLGALAEIGKPQVLFQTRVDSTMGPIWHQYDVMPGGQRFLVNTQETVTAPVTVVLNWPALVRP
jgi:dipeptidyl aminopeptidase/acylaminoacyl peptidase